MSRKVFISSANRTSGTVEDFTITHNLPQNIKWRRVKLLSARIPNTFNNIVTGVNDTFTLTGTTSGANLITIPPNNYSGNTLASAVESLINTAVAPQSYTVNYSATLGQFTFAGSETFNLTFAADNIFGFPGGTTATASTHTSSLNGDVNNKLTFGGFVAVCTDLIGGIDNGIINLKDNITQTRALDYIPLCGSGTVTNYSTSPEFPSFPIYKDDRSTIRFYLEFPNGAAVDINGNNWSIMLLFES